MSVARSARLALLPAAFFLVGCPERPDDGEEDATPAVDSGPPPPVDSGPPPGMDSGPGADSGT